MAGEITQLYPDSGSSNALKIQGKDVSGIAPTDGQGLIFQEATQEYVPSAIAGGTGAVDSVNSKTGDVVLDSTDVGALQSNYTTETFVYDDITEVLPARRNARWFVNFIVSGGTRTLWLPYVDVLVGDRLWMTFVTPANTTVVVRRPNPGISVVVATLSAGQRVIYAAECVENSAGTMIWASRSELSGLLGAVPQNANSAGSVGQMAFVNNFLYVCVSDDTWRRVPVSAW